MTQLGKEIPLEKGVSYVASFKQTRTSCELVYIRQLELGNLARCFQQVVISYCPRASEILTEIGGRSHSLAGHIHRYESRIAVSVDAFEFLFQN